MMHASAPRSSARGSRRSSGRRPPPRRRTRMRRFTGSSPSAASSSRALQQRPELALVVGDAARVKPLVADGRLERLRCPRARAAPAAARRSGRRRGSSARRRARRADLADRRAAAASLDELGLAAGAPHEVAHPLPRPPHVAGVRGVRADARDAEQLARARRARPGPRRGESTADVRRRIYATSRRICASASARSFFSVWFSIWRMRSRVTLNVRPTSSSVRGCWPSRP